MTKISDIPNLEKQISSIKDKQDSYKNKLISSPSALGGSGQPSKTDLFNQEEYNRLKKEITNLENTRQKVKWYGSDTYDEEEDTGTKMGLVGSTLDWITKPLYGIVGATEHLVGQGKGSFYEDVRKNIKTDKHTFGNVLRTAGVPGVIAAPLGFALDIFGDPTNWATMGTSALLPKIGYGAYKGLKAGNLAKGISTATKAGLLEKAAFVGKYTPVLKNSKTMKSIGKKTLKATEKWEKLSGITPAKLITQRGMGVGSYRIGLKDVVDNVAKRIPGGEKALEHFVYDPVGWVERARIKDMLQDILGTNIDDTKDAVAAVLRGESSAEYLPKALAAGKEKIRSAKIGVDPFDFKPGKRAKPVSREGVEKSLSALDNEKIAGKLNASAGGSVQDVDGAISILKDPDKYKTIDPVESARRMISEKIGGNGITMKELGEVVDSGALGQTGVEWYDNLIKGVRSYTKAVGKNKDKILIDGKKTLDMYDRTMAIFRLAKVALSPTAWTNAVVGNLVMAHMSGGLTPRFVNRLSQARRFYTNSKGGAADIDKVIREASVAFGYNAGHIGNELKTTLRTSSKNLFGSVDFLDTKASANRIVQAGIDAGKISSKEGKAARKSLEEALENLAASKNAAREELVGSVDEVLAASKAVNSKDIPGDLKKIVDEKNRVKAGAGTTSVREATGTSFKTGKKIDQSEVGSGLLSNELFEKEAARRMFDDIAKKAKDNPNNKAWGLLNWSLNTAPSGYESLDQISKLASFLTSVADGYSVNQLRQMRHLVQISAEELAIGKRTIEKTGEVLYRLSPERALELSSSQFLNYAAMPSAVKVLRNMPVLGSPFISFMYGMSLKTAQTLAYNASSFNKVEFALKEFGGQKTPLEKKALESGRYSYLKEPGMYRWPFENENPFYLNLSSMIPYYSLNMFDPSQTDYGDSVSEKLTQMAQNSVFMKDPVGSVAFNYLIQPLILKKGIEPQGQFGQPLYPTDATKLEKFLYGTRTLSEAYVPNALSYAGLFTPEAAADFLPYRWAKLTLAARAGKSRLGIKGKEGKVPKTARTLFQTSGIPVQAPINTNYNAKK